jgi:hypothetical protein
MPIPIISNLPPLDLLSRISLGLILLYIGKIIVDEILAKTINDRLIHEAAARVKKAAKAKYTRFKPIKASFRFSVDIEEDITVSALAERLEDAFRSCEEISEETVEITDITKAGSKKIDASVVFSNNDPFNLCVEMVQDNSSLRSADVDSISEAKVSSVGITIDFTFPFHDLKGVLIDLGTFIGFLQRSLANEFEVNNFTKSTIVVEALDNGLTLDDWIEKERFDVSLLLQSEESDRSVRFYGDRAEITSPYTEIDDRTAEYVRATLLNYYL